MNHFVFLSFYFGAKNGSPALGMANSLVVRRVSRGRIIVVLFGTKYAVPRHIKPGILKLTPSRGQRNLFTVFIFVSREEKGFYRIVSLGHQNFDCRSYCGLSRRMQGSACLYTKVLMVPANWYSSVADPGERSEGPAPSFLGLKKKSQKEERPTGQATPPFFSP